MGRRETPAKKKKKASRPSHTSESHVQVEGIRLPLGQHVLYHLHKGVSLAGIHEEKAVHGTCGAELKPDADGLVALQVRACANLEFVQLTASCEGRPIRNTNVGR